MWFEKHSMVLYVTLVLLVTLIDARLNTAAGQLLILLFTNGLAICIAGVWNLCLILSKNVQTGGTLRKQNASGLPSSQPPAPSSTPPMAGSSVKIYGWNVKDED